MRFSERGAQRLPASKRFPLRCAGSFRKRRRSAQRLPASKRFPHNLDELMTAMRQECSTPSGIKAVPTQLVAAKPSSQSAQRLPASKRFPRQPRPASTPMCAQRLPASKRFPHGSALPSTASRVLNAFRHQSGSHRARTKAPLPSAWSAQRLPASKRFPHRIGASCAAR